MIIHLGRLLPGGSSDTTLKPKCGPHPETPLTESSIASLFGLASAGVYQARMSPPCRWALTPPFHHFRAAPKRDPAVFFSVALSPGHPELPLTASLPYEVPTFLSPDCFIRATLSGHISAPASDHPPCSSLGSSKINILPQPRQRTKDSPLAISTIICGTMAIKHPEQVLFLIITRGSVTYRVRTLS